MLTLELEKAEQKTINGHKYYVFPYPPTHTNDVNRPTEYADEKVLKKYTGKGSNNEATLHPDVMNAANLLMTALREYGDTIGDWSMQNAVIQNGFRGDNATQGANYLRIIKQRIAEHPELFKDAPFPANLETDAQSVLGRPGDPRRTAFRQKLSTSPNWNGTLVYQLFNNKDWGVDYYYSPRGSNPHSTGFVFDLDFPVYCDGKEDQCGVKGKPCFIGEYNVGANGILNRYALRSAAGMWLNKYSMQFNFDSYNTEKEIWHMEYRKQ